MPDLNILKNYQSICWGDGSVSNVPTTEAWRPGFGSPPLKQLGVSVHMYNPTAGMGWGDMYAKWEMGESKTEVSLNLISHQSGQIGEPL